MMTDSFDVKIVNRRQRLIPENGLLTQREVDRFCKVRKPELNRNFNIGHQSIQRTELMIAALGALNATTVDVRQIGLEPGQQTGRHLHPCPVVGYIIEGTALDQIEGEPSKPCLRGQPLRPAEVVIAQFGNASVSVPMTFVAFYLLDGEQSLIEMLDS